MSLAKFLVRSTAFLAMSSLPVFAQPALTISWSMLLDADAQVYEDPYRDLTSPQMNELMALARVQQLLTSGERSETEVEELQQKADAIERDFESEGLDASWILSQREIVAERRQHAAVATNNQLEGKQVELSGYFIHAVSLESGESVAYLLPDRGFCMHLPTPPPNQIVRLVVEKLPDPLGPCIAAAVRGRLTVEESQNTISSADGPAQVWSRWKMNDSEVTTSGALPVQRPTGVR